MKVQMISQVTRYLDKAAGVVLPKFVSMNLIKVPVLFRQLDVKNNVTIFYQLR